MSDDLTRAIAEVRLRQYDSEYSSDHLTWEDFTDEADEIAATLAPLIEARVREARAEAWDETAEEAYGWGWLHGWALADVKGRNPYREDEDNG